MSDQLKPRQRPFAIWVLVVLIGFLSLSGFAGGYGFISDPSGAEVGFPPETIHKLPISNYLLPGLYLFFVYGCVGAFVAIGLLKPKVCQWAKPIQLSSRYLPVWSLAVELGILLDLWIIVQVIFLGPPIAALQVVYFSLGTAILGIAMLPVVKRYYSAF